MPIDSIQGDRNNNLKHPIKMKSFSILTYFQFQVFFMIFSLIVVIVFSLSFGRYDIPFLKVVKILISNVFNISPHWENVEERVIELVRLPRILVACLCGAALSLAGATLQGIFRNPLVGPEIIGVSSGAAFGGVLAILLLMPDYFIPVMAFIFGIIALLLTMSVARAGGAKNVLSLVLGGIVTSAFFTALVSFAKYTADPDNTLPAIVYWLMGSFNESNYNDLLFIFLPIITIGTLIYKMRHVINILSLGEEEAKSLGINVQCNRWIILLSTAMLIATTVSISGIIGWVGIIMPHFARMITGANHARLIPIAMLSGAIYMILADTIARTASYGEIPISVITALVGAPIFAFLLYRTQLKGWSNG